jgi:SAM-dependent methyltransferase
MGTASRARYDGFADWYEALFGPRAEANRAALARLLGPGMGPCLDVGCGTGLHFQAVRASGRVPVGVDRSADQLRYARARGVCVQADAVALPFGDGVFAAVLMVWISTDVDDFAAVVREAVRVLRPGGLLVFWGAHPCFMGPQIEYRAAGGVVVHPTYRLAGWHEEQPWWTGPHGLRKRVGMRQVPLAELLQAFLDAGLVLQQVVEPEPQHPVPFCLALRMVRPG